MIDFDGYMKSKHFMKGSWIFEYVEQESVRNLLD